MESANIVNSVAFITAANGGAAGRPMADEEAGLVTWDVWMRKKRAIG